MSKKQMRQSTRRQNQTLNGELDSSFIDGMVKDLEKSKIPTGAVYDMSNVVGRRDGYTGRSGSRALFVHRLPAVFDIVSGLSRDSLLISKLENKITITDVDPSKLFSEADVSKYLSFGDYSNTFEIKSIDNSTFVATVDGVDRYSTCLVDDNVIETTVDIADSYVRGRINATIFDQRTKRLYILLGNVIYSGHIVADGEGFDLEEIDGKYWNEVYRSGDTIPEDAISSTYKIKDDIFLLNSNGIFRISTGNKESRQYYWKSNIEAPAQEYGIQDVNKTSPWEYNYRYIHTLTRFKDGGLNGDRTNNFIEHETCPRIISQAEKDYANIFSASPSVESPILFPNALQEKWLEHNSWKDSGKVAMDLVFGSEYYQSGIIAEADPLHKLMLLDFSNVSSMADVVEVVQNAINMITSKMRITIGRSPESGSQSISWQWHSLDTSYVEWDSAPIWFSVPIDESGIPVDPDTSDPLYDPTFMNGNYSAPMGRQQVTANLSKNVKIGPLSPVDDSGNYSNISTHHTTYRTADLSATFTDNDNIEQIRVINDPNRFIWVEDLPLIRFFRGWASGRWIYTTVDAIKSFDVGSYVGSIDLGSTMLISDTTTTGYRTYQSGLFRWGSESDTKVFFTGVDENNVFSASRLLDSDEIVTSYLFVMEDIGKLIFWEDGTTSIIKTISSIGVAYTVDTGLKDSQFGGINPVERSFNDKTSDEVLLSRQKNAPLRTRFYAPLPKASLGLVIPGFIILADRMFGELFYGETSTYYDIGYHNIAAQRDATIEDEITSLTQNDGNIVIRTKYKTFEMYPSQAFQGGDIRFNESFFLITSPVLMDSSRGVLHSSNVRKFDETRQLVFTSEPAVRMYSAEGYSADTTKGTINEAIISRMDQQAIINTDSDDILIWSTGVDNGDI